MSDLNLPDLDDNRLGAEPIEEFKMWFDEAIKAGIPQPDAMVLATATSSGEPSARVVLLKSVDHRGFAFYTNYGSRKGRELAANPHAALTFFWPTLHRQVRIEGTAAMVSVSESDSYFARRPRDGQLSSLTSKQSQTIRSRAELDQRFEELKSEFQGKPIPRPEQWGGYRVRPMRIEFWQERYARLNDRILYTRQADGTWARTRLQP